MSMIRNSFCFQSPKISSNQNRRECSTIHTIRREDYRVVAARGVCEAEGFG